MFLPASSATTPISLRPLGPENPPPALIAVRQQRLEEHRRLARAVFRSLCERRRCGTCGAEHIALACAPAHAPCLACVDGGRRNIPTGDNRP